MTIAGLLHLVSPDDYARVVRGYCLLETGAGQDHTALAELLVNNEQAANNNALQTQLPDGFVVLYQLGGREVVQNTTSAGARPLPPNTLSSPSTPASPQTLHPFGSDVDADSADERRHESLKATAFHNPADFLTSDAVSGSGKCVPQEAHLIFCEATCRPHGSRTLGRDTASTPNSFAAT
jgi:hypothetical protein